MKDNLLCCSQRFGYQHLLTNVVTTCVITTAIPAVLATNPTADPPVLAVAGVPQSVTYSNPIKVLEVYSDKLLDIAQKKASLIWGNQSFTAQEPKEIFELTAANGNLTAGGKLNANGKNIIQQYILSKIMAYQTLAMMTDEAHQVIEQKSDIFTWKDPTGNEDEEMDGLTIIALIL